MVHKYLHLKSRLFLVQYKGKKTKPVSIELCRTTASYQKGNAYGLTCSVSDSFALSCEASFFRIVL